MCYLSSLLSCKQEEEADQLLEFLWMQHRLRQGVTLAVLSNSSP